MPIIRIRFRKMNPSMSPGLRALRSPPPPPQLTDSEEDTCSISSLDEPTPISQLLSTLTKDLETVANASTTMRKQVKRLYSRASRELVDWMEVPLTPIPALALWLERHGAPQQPSIQEFITLACKVATRLDLPGRTLTFSEEDAAALGFAAGPAQTTIFALFAALPRLFL